MYKSEKQRAEVINAITNLPISGGGDCPELAFAGMLNAFNNGPQYSSPMFVFTDASAKDDSRSNIDALKAAASSYSSPITFFANPDGCGSGINSFKEIASYTSGILRVFIILVLLSFFIVMWVVALFLLQGWIFLLRFLILNIGYYSF